MENKIKDNFQLNYIKCPECKNILDLSFIDKICPNPLCGFDFDGLRAILDNGEKKPFLEPTKEQEWKWLKLLQTAFKHNMGNHLATLAAYNNRADYYKLYPRSVIRELDDLEALKTVLLSDVIKLDKKGVIKSRFHYRMFYDFYEYLMSVNYQEIRNFLRLTFPDFYKTYYKERKERHENFMQQGSVVKKDNQSRLI